VVHHFIVNELEPIFERIFIHDSYACRKGKGTLFGIGRMERFSRAVTHSYTQEAYVLKLDISGFFMSIDRGILLAMIERVIEKKYHGKYSDTLNFLVHTVLGNDPTKNCIIKGNKQGWIGLPRSKSLFFASDGVGLPIGNLTSQVFANLYLHPLDKFIKKHLKIRYYGRYVDDFVLMHTDAEYLRSLVPRIRDFLARELQLELHPDKIFLNKISNGFPFLGAYIKPYRTYLGTRTKRNFYSKIREFHTRIASAELANSEIKIDKRREESFVSAVNSYLGIARHFSTYRLRKRILITTHSGFLRSRFRLFPGYYKILPKKPISPSK